MSIELERAIIANRIRAAIGNLTARWRREDKPAIYMMTIMLTEVMWEVAANTKYGSAEKGIIAGVKMMETWEDD